MLEFLRGYAWVVLLSAGVLGCGGDDDDGSTAEAGISAATLASYEGIYALSTLTHNDAGCDVEGPSLLTDTTEKQFVMVGASAFGQRYLELASCSDTTDCTSKVLAIRQPNVLLSDYSLILSKEVNADALGGFSAMSGYDMDGTCVERSFEDHALTRSGDSVRVQSRLTPLADKPADGGVCWAEPAKQTQEAAGRPCTELRVIAGTKTGPLPE